MIKAKEDDKILHTEIIVPKMVIAHLSVTLARLMFGIDIVIHFLVDFVVICSLWCLNGGVALTGVCSHTTVFFCSRLQLTIFHMLLCSFYSFLSCLVLLIIKEACFSEQNSNCIYCQVMACTTCSLPKCAKLFHSLLLNNPFDIGDINSLLIGKPLVIMNSNLKTFKPTIPAASVDASPSDLLIISACILSSLNLSIMPD